MSGECQVNVKSQSELDIGGRETFRVLICSLPVFLAPPIIDSKPGFFLLNSRVKTLELPAVPVRGRSVLRPGLSSLD